MRLSHIIAVVVSLIVGGGGGFAVGIFVYPFLFPPAPAMEMLAEGDAQNLVAYGRFIHADPNDPTHYGSGDVRIVKGNTGRHKVFLDKNFKVGPGPRFHVYLSKNPKVLRNSDFSEAESIDLGKIRAFEGSQVCDVPSSVDITPVKSVVIWCKEFGVLISPATLARPDS